MQQAAFEGAKQNECLEDARVRQLKRTELAWRVESAQCLRSPQKSMIFGGPD